MVHQEGRFKRVSPRRLHEKLHRVPRCDDLDLKVQAKPIFRPAAAFREHYPMAECAPWCLKSCGLSVRALCQRGVGRAFNAIGAANMGAAHERPGCNGMPIEGDDVRAIAMASCLQCPRGVG